MSFRLFDPTGLHQPQQFPLFHSCVQLLLPILVTLFAFSPYLARLAWNKIQPGKYPELELVHARNQAIASSLKFLNVVRTHAHP